MKKFLIVAALGLFASTVVADAQPCGPRCQAWRQRVAAEIVQAPPAPVMRAAVQPAPVVDATPVYAADGIPQARTGGYVVPQGTVVQQYQFYGWSNGQRVLLTQPGFVSAGGGTVVPAYPPPWAFGRTWGQAIAGTTRAVINAPGAIVGGVVGGAVGGLFGAF